jgi:5-formyltetrahydrofolate cyclo-ligase
MDKKSLRKNLIQAYQEISPDQKNDWDKELSAQIIKAIEAEGIKSLHCYLSTPYEFNTQPIIDHCFEEDIKVYVPKIEGKGHLSHWELTAKSTLIAGPMGIMEPHEGALMQTEPELILVPGLAFTAKGERLGFGGGYYDRFLATNKTSLTWAVCYPLALQNKIPTETHDIIINRVFMIS